MKRTVLITGASGLIGQRLTTLLLQKGCRVLHLVRAPKQGSVPAFLWDPDKGVLDPRAWVGVDTLIHLAGAGIGDKRWTPERKREILESRLKSTALLVDSLKNNPHQLKTVITASAIGYYGFGDDVREFTEESGPGGDFLASVVVRWEQETERFRDLDCRVVKPRIGVVLSQDGGALREIIRPIRWGVGAPLGSGQQVMSWIHIDDLCELFVFLMESEHLQGVFNAVAPQPVTNRELTREIASQLHLPLFLPAVPALLLRLVLGEMANLVVKGNRVSGARIVNAGFQFRFPQLKEAIADLLRPAR